MTLRLCCFLGLLGYYEIAISTPTDRVREVEIQTIDFEGLWLTTSDASFPKDAIRAFPEDAKRELAEAHPLDFVWVDLDGDGENEIIVASRLASGSGNTGYFILRKVEKAWQLIGEFQGTLILSGAHSLSGEGSLSNFYRVISYYRLGGETYQRTYDYRNGKYLRIGDVRISGIVSHSCWWQLLWLRLKSYGNDKGKSSRCDSSIAERKRAAPPSSTELTAFDFGSRWLSITDPSFPKAAMKAIPKDILEEGDFQLSFLSVDLVGDRQNELIINSQMHGGSGGNYYFVLKKNGKTWQQIGEFLGGLVLSLENGPRPSSYRITSYYRSGDTYQNTYDYRKGKYRLTNQVLIPIVVSRSCWWTSFWSRLVGSGDPAGASLTDEIVRMQKWCRHE